MINIKRQPIMKSFKSILLIFTLFFSLVTLSAQKKTTLEKATEKIEEMSQQIISIDKTLALDEEQKKAMIHLQVLKLEDVKKVKNLGLSEEETKIKSKEIYKKSYTEMAKVISKEQMGAYREGKKKK